MTKSIVILDDGEFVESSGKSTLLIDLDTCRKNKSACLEMLEEVVNNYSSYDSDTA